MEIKEIKTVVEDVSVYFEENGKITVCYDKGYLSKKNGYIGTVTSEIIQDDYTEARYPRQLVVEDDDELSKAKLYFNYDTNEGFVLERIEIKNQTYMYDPENLYEFGDFYKLESDENGERKTNLTKTDLNLIQSLSICKKIIHEFVY